MVFVQVFWGNVQGWFDLYSAEIFLTLIAAYLLLAIGYIVQLRTVTSLKKRYRTLMMGRGGVNMEGLLNSYGKAISESLERQKAFELRLSELDRQLKLSITGIGLVRFNAFQETGSDLSFSLALLDRRQNGVVLTSIFGREESRCYGKPVSAGQSLHPLSDEEKKALDEAVLKMGF